MARDYIIKDKVADGDFLFPPMNSNYWSMLLSSICFYSDEDYQTQVVPSAGTVKLMLSADGVNFSSVPAGEFSAIDAYNPDRTKPNALGVATHARLTMQGVSGATHFKAILSRTA